MYRGYCTIITASQDGRSLASVFFREKSKLFSKSWVRQLYIVFFNARNHQLITYPTTVHARPALRTAPPPARPAAAPAAPPAGHAGRAAHPAAEHAGRAAPPAAELAGRAALAAAPAALATGRQSQGGC